MATATRTRKTTARRAPAKRTRTTPSRTEFVNKTQGFVGVIKLDRLNEAQALPVEPGDRVFLTDEEIELTEQAVARREASPFTIREIVHYEQKTGVEIARFHAAPLTRVDAADNAAEAA